MTDKRISQLVLDGAPDTGNIFETERAGLSYKLTVAQIQALVAASLALSGLPTAPTAAPGTNSLQVATTAFAEAIRVALDTAKANLASPTFTGVPAAPTPPVGTNTTQLATSKMIQDEIANKRTWTAYTPTITPQAGTFTSASATGRRLVMFGICFVDIIGTFTTKGTGTFPSFSLPFPALAGSGNLLMSARETQVNGKTGLARINPGLTGLLTADYTGGADLVTADGCVVHITGWYPIA